MGSSYFVVSWLVLAFAVVGCKNGTQDQSGSSPGVKHKPAGTGENAMPATIKPPPAMAVPMKPALPTDVPQKGPAKNGKPPKGTLTAQFAHHKRRNMIRTFSSSVDNESRVTVKMYADGSVTLDDKGKWLDRVTYSKLTACQSRVEEKRWDTLYEGTWEQNGKQLVIKTKLVNEKCTQGVTCDSRPPEMTPCGPVTKTLILTCTADSLTLKQDKKSIPAWKCDMGKAATHTSNPWNFGRDQCVERYMGNRWPFYYRPCAAQKPN